MTVISRIPLRTKLLALLLLLLPAMTFADPGNGTIEAMRIKTEIVLDGELSESEWPTDAALPLTGHVPTFGLQPSEKTEIMLLYDDEYLYVGARLWDSEPDKIQGPSKKRDQLGWNNDWFGIILDSFDDNENGLCFFTTPSGLRLDMTVSADAIGMDPINLDWNTFWDVAVSRNDSGWFAEIRIPFSSLRYQPKDGVVKMGVISWRWIARKNEMITFPAIEPKWGNMSSFKPSQAGDVLFYGIPPQKPLYITPYLLAGIEQRFELDQAETHYERKDDPVLEAGLDLKYSLTSKLTLDLTLNTDFAQVEADDQQFNLNRFSLFFPEKRQFFQERASIFDIRVGGPSRIFYSRQVGLNDGEPVRILGGVRLTGKAGLYDLGFMNMQTAREGELMAENLSVVRLRRQLFNPNSYVGGIFTNRMDFKGNFNRVYALDGFIRLFGNDYLQVKWAQSFENGKDNELFSLKPTRVFINWERNQYEGFVYDLSFGLSGEDYHPGMGFESREDFINSWYIWNYGWIPGEQSKLLRHHIVSRNNIYYNHVEKQRESSWNSLGWEFETKSGYMGGFTFSFRQERVFEAFDISDLTIAAGDYQYFEAQWNFSTSSSGLFGIASEFTAGEFFDGNRFSFSITPTWNLNSNIELSGFFEYNHLSFPKQGSKENIQIARVKMLYMFSTKLSASGFVQYDNAERVFLGNFRLRYNPKEGNDLYLVYNEDLNTQRSLAEPILPPSNGRTILLKYTHTLKK